MANYKEFHARSIQNPEGFWRDEAKRIHWNTPFSRVLDYSRPPFAKWFVGGTTNLCFNAVDRHLPQRGDQAALVYISVETPDGAPAEKTTTYNQLYREVNRFAGILRGLGVGHGDRVLIYMPMVPEAVFAMLACARIGALHSVVFGGFASVSLATRIDDAKPKVIISADAGSRSGKVVPYKGLLDEAIKLAQHPPHKVVLVNRGLAEMPLVSGRDLDYARLRAEHMNDEVPCEWLESSEPSYILYTSGTTGKPKGVQRDTGGYAVALAASMEEIFCCKPGETFFCTSDIGWVVGHSYIVYAPLINGCTTILFEGTPLRPDAGIWWHIVEKTRATSMFSSPTAIRVLKKQDPAFLKKYDLSSLRLLFLAGEPLDEPTAHWIADGIGKPIIDNYWQTETGWPILAIPRGVEQLPSKFGSPGLPSAGYNVKVFSEADGSEVGPNVKGVVGIEGPLPPGCMSTVWGDDERFVKTYWTTISRKSAGRLAYSTFDWGIRDADGYFFILGRTDDVINVAGHRLGTREIEESISSHSNIAEVAVIGVADQLKGQVAVAFAVVKDTSKTATPELRLAHEGEVMKLVDSQLGAVARPARVHFVSALPKTRSGKLLRRSIQALCEGRDPGDLTTIEDPTALDQIRAAVAAR
jgi:propionyl-CoA synthetase